MVPEDRRKTLLTPYQKRKLREYEKILEITGLNPDRVLDLVANEPEAVVPFLKSMTDQAVRSDVVFEYTLIDMELDYELYYHLFGTGKKLIAAKRTKRFKTFRLILQNLYVMQKLSIVRNFKKIPKRIVSKIAAVNDLRNGLTHSFDLTELKPTKRTYRGYNIFTQKGLEKFREDVMEIRYFFMPELKQILEE